MQPPKSDPAAAAGQQLSEDEAEAFIAQEGADGFEGEVIDDLEGEGALMHTSRLLCSSGRMRWQQQQLQQQHYSTSQSAGHFVLVQHPQHVARCA